jgi:outer membrane protein assembly factor BamB
MLRRPWVPAVLATAGLGWILLLWAQGEVAHAQGRILNSMLIGAGTLVLVLAWTVFLSPLPGRVRGGLAGLMLVLAACVRIEGTSGDLVPSLGFRWAGARVRRAEPVATSPAGALKPGSFPGFFGPERDGRVDAALDPAWTARPPTLLWRRDVGAAWSGIVVEAGRAVTQEQQDAEEAVTAYDMATGRPLWRQAVQARFETTLAGLGPRATPTIAAGRVYALGATGRLSCLELMTGAPVWAVDVGAPVPEYGFASSPLVDGDAVIVQAGGPLAAFDRATGAKRWTSASDDTGYASPRLVELAGRRQVVAIHRYACAGYDPASGARLWRYEWRGDIPKVAQPVTIGGGRLVISAGYGVGADAFRVGPDLGVTQLWSSRRLKAKLSNVVHRDGHLYGLDDGRLTCVSAETGERAWSGERYGHGQLLLAGDLLLISSEKGEAVLVDAAPEAFRERARLPLLGGKTWNSPALAGPYLLMRNDREAVCLELPLR